MNYELKALNSFLKQIVTRAGEISLDYKTRLAGIKITQKETAKDLVTEADVAVENYLVEQIKRRYPDHAICGEETGLHTGGDYRWIIDPIDGTLSFIHNQPFYSISVAVEHRGQTLLAAVNAPVLGEFFTAELGQGATLNDNPIRVSNCDTLADAMLATGFACMRGNQTRNNMPYFNTLMPKIRDIRRYGSAAIDLCYLACGKIDGLWELYLQIYDIAAGVLIAQEAGATVTDFSGKNTDNLPGEIMATNGKLHNELSEILMEIR